MELLNYHHLLYFFTVAREGSVARASARLGLKQPTVSAQVHLLERKLGRKLLERSGRGLKVTPAGETVLRYAQSIFALGGELLSALDGQAEVAPTLAAGVSSTLPQALAAALLEGVFAALPRPLVTIVEGAPEAFPAPLATGSLHLALMDVKPQMGGAGALHSRILLESTVELFAPAALARKLRKDFPSRIAGAPVLLPSGGGVRREVESWLARRKLRVLKLGEMPHPEIHAAAAGAAIFAPSVLRESLKRSHGLLPVGSLEGARWQLFAVTAGKSLRPAALDAVMRSAKELR
jgi:LysR family transcriptional activator of nhaA